MLDQIINYFESIDPILAALYASLFTWILTALGAALVFFFTRGDSELQVCGPPMPLPKKSSSKSHNKTRVSALWRCAQLNSMEPIIKLVDYSWFFEPRDGLSPFKQQRNH